MTTKSKENKTTNTDPMQEAKDAIAKLQTSVSSLRDQMFTVEHNMAKLTERVSADIKRLVELRNKDANELRNIAARK